jgi:hypothetical protein
VATDVIDRVVALPVELSANGLPVEPLDADRRRFRLNLPKHDTTLTLAARSTDGALTVEKSILLSTGPAATVITHQHEELLDVEVDDAHGNPTRGTPVARSNRGVMAPLSAIGPGRWQGRWTPSSPNEREEAIVSVEVPESAVGTREVMRHYPPWSVQLGVFAGVLAGRGVGVAYGGLSSVEVRLPGLPKRLSLDLIAAVWAAERQQHSTDGLHATRRAVLAPIGLGASYEWPIGLGWRVDLGVTAGPLVTTSSVDVQRSGESLVRSGSVGHTAAQVSPWCRLGRRLGPGLASLVANGLITASSLPQWSDRPIVGSVTIGYTWER